MDLAGGGGGQAVPVGGRAHQVGVAQLVPATHVVLRQRVPEPARRRPPDCSLEEMNFNQITEYSKILAK